MRLRLLGCVLVAQLASCTYITQSEYEAQLLLRDDDEDGFTVGDGDCDDQNPEAYPGRAEIAYDGADNDCLGDGDLLDLDQDGFDHIAHGGDDCRDANPAIRPTATDPPYDIIDQDCAKDNDFDADKDGFMPNFVTQEDVDEYKATWNVQFEEKWGDCDDFDDTAYPGAQGELPYDGVDTDCDGADDFDADGDGYPFPEDCLDTRNSDIDLDPVDVYPGAKEIFRDGWDSDCAGDNDFDADGDGHVRQGDASDYDAYVQLYGYKFVVESFADCDDDDALVYPGAIEVLGDKIDQDCDNRRNAAPWGFGSFDWRAPRSPRLVHAGDHFVIATTADEVDDGVNLLDNAVTALVFDDLPASPAQHVQRLTVLGPDATEDLDDGLGLTPTADGFAVASVDERAAGRAFSLLQTLEFNGYNHVVDDSSSQSFDGDPFSVAATDLLDTGSDLWLWSCGEQVVQATRGSDLATASTTLTFTATGCVAHGTGSTGTVCGPTDCQTFDFAPAGPTLTPAASQPFSGQSFVRLRRHGTLVTTVNTDNGVTVHDGTSSTSYLAGLTVQRAVTVEQDGMWYLAAIIGSGTNVNIRLGWGAVGGTLETTQLSSFDFQRPDLLPLDIAVAASSDRLMVVTTLTEEVKVSNPDAVAWMVFGTPP